MREIIPEKYVIRYANCAGTTLIIDPCNQKVFIPVNYNNEIYIAEELRISLSSKEEIIRYAIRHEEFNKEIAFHRHGANNKDARRAIAWSDSIPEQVRERFVQLMKSYHGALTAYLKKLLGDDN